MNNKNKNLIVYSLTLLTSFIVFTIMLMINDNPDYLSLNLLPIFFFLIVTANFNTFLKLFNSFSILLMIGCYYMRMVILPLIYVLFEYSSLVTNSDFSLYIKFAVLLAIYEFLFVMIFCKIKFNRIGNNICRKDESSNDVMKIDINNKKTTFIIIALSFFVFISFLLYPDFKSYFHFIFETNMDNRNSYSINFLIMQEKIPKLLYWLGVITINILQVLIPMKAISLIYKCRISQNLKLILSLVIIAIICLISTPEVARSITISLSLCIMLIKIYPAQKKKVFFIIICCLLPAVFYGLFVKAGVYEIGNSISSILQAYFSGIPNIATCFLIPGRPNVQMIFVDIIKAFPFIMVFFKDIKSTPNLFNYVLYGNLEGAGSQIIPMVGQSFYYFGFLLAPIISIFSVRIALYFEKKYKKSNDIFEKYVFLLCSIYFAVAPIVYNFSIMVSTFIQLFLPCILIVLRKGTIKIRRLNNKC